MIDRPKTKRERVKALLESLPVDAGVMPATELDADEQPVQLEQDGQILTGNS